MCVCVCAFTIHHGGFDGLDAGHDLGQVGEGGVGTRDHLEDTAGLKNVRNGGALIQS